jgi:hypothetical protein
MDVTTIKHSKKHKGNSMPIDVGYHENGFDDESILMSLNNVLWDSIYLDADGETDQKYFDDDDITLIL